MDLNLLVLKQRTFYLLRTAFPVTDTRQTPIEAKLWKDGKALPAKEVEAVVEQEKVLFKIKKPSREGSGKYTIKLSNAQGEDSKDVSIIMQSVPSAPQEVAVTEVFQTSCVVAWKTPQDDGGSPIVKYVIERQVKVKIIIVQKYELLNGANHNLFFSRTCLSKQDGTTLLKLQLASR